MTDLGLHQAGMKDAARIGSITGRAFADDPINLWILHKPALITRFMTQLARGIYLPYGFCEYLDGDQGATMWLPAGVKADMSLGTTLAMLKDAILCGVPGALQRGTAFSAIMNAVKPREPHFYLFTIGVVPEAQGKGLGGALLRSGLARADAAGMPTYLESSKWANVPIYQRYGFELRDEPDLPDGCPPMYPMWRPVGGGRG